MGRPIIELDWVEFEKLLEMQCTEEEIAQWFRCSVDTIDRRTKEHFGITFAELKPQKAIRGKVAIRRGLFQLALKGNVAALIFLSKNLLGYSDKQEVKTIDDPNKQLEIDKLTAQLVDLRSISINDPARI